MSETRIISQVSGQSQVIFKMFSHPRQPSPGGLHVTSTNILCPRRGTRSLGVVNNGPGHGDKRETPTPPTRTLPMQNQ